MPPARHNGHLVLINGSQLCLHPSTASYESPALDRLGSRSFYFTNSSVPARGVAWGRQRRKHHWLCLMTESAFKFISVTLARASPSGINDAGVICLLILHHCKIPGESPCFLPPSSSIHGVFVRSSRGKAVNMFGITLYTPPPRDSSQSWTASQHLIYLPAAPNP